MKFRVGCEIDYMVSPPAALFLNLRVKPAPGVKVTREELEITPQVHIGKVEELPTGSRYDWITASDNGDLSVRYRAEVSTRHRLIPVTKLRKTKQPRIEASMLHWLFPSRYCQSDMLGRLATQKFGKLGNPLDQTRAIADWIYTHVDYVPGQTDSSTSARDTLTECAGVCRDFSHLGIALCRALSIPARYITGYSHQLEPPDFHACFEAWIGGTWILFDATRLAPMNGFVPIGVGRDAADVSFSNAFGPASLKRQAAWCEALGKDFKPVKHDAGVVVSIDGER